MEKTRQDHSKTIIGLLVLFSFLLLFQSACFRVKSTNSMTLEASTKAEIDDYYSAQEIEEEDMESLGCKVRYPALYPCSRTDAPLGHYGLYVVQKGKLILRKAINGSGNKLDLCSIPTGRHSLSGRSVGAHIDKMHS